MNITTLTAKLRKNGVSTSSEVTVVVDNKEYPVVALSQSVGKVILLTEVEEEVPVAPVTEDTPEETPEEEEVVEEETEESDDE